MIKTLLLFTILCVSLFASTIESKIAKFEKDRFSKNERIKIQTISINIKKSMPREGWYGYIVDIKASMAGKIVKAKDIVFSDGEIISTELYDLDSLKSYKELMLPKLTSKYYDESKLIAGTHKAQDRIVVFSDPLCPFCMDLIPDVIKHVKKHKEKIALYYYHFPLIRIHPASLFLTKLIEHGKTKGIRDIEEKVYTKDWDKYFDPKEKDEKKIIKAFNEEFFTDFTQKDINTNEIKENIKKDMKMGEDLMVNGTPTIFINGYLDKTKLKYETLGK